LTVVGNVHYNYRNGLWPMQYVFLIRSSAGGKKYVTRRSRVKYFLPPVRERIKNTYCMAKKPFLFLLLIYMRFLTIFYAKNMELSFIADYDSERVCRWGVFWTSIRLIRSTPFNSFPFWVIFCHITLERSWVIGFCLHFCWMYVATAITCSKPSPSSAPAQTNWCNRTWREDFSDYISEHHQWLTLTLRH